MTGNKILKFPRVTDIYYDDMRGAKKKLSVQQTPKPEAQLPEALPLWLLHSEAVLQVPVGVLDDWLTHTCAHASIDR